VSDNLKTLQSIAKSMDNPVIQWAAAEIARLRESLAIFVHAHETGNSVSRHLEAAAKSLVKEVSGG